MKQFLLLFFTLIILGSESKASHVLGGEISWVCLPNGKYIFYMIVFEDCGRVTYVYEQETIKIIGNPLPKDAFGNTFSTIQMNRDLSRWNSNRKGDTSPLCTNQYGSPYSCEDKDPGTIQQYFYASPQITMHGVPDRSGWKFYWESICCRSGNLNLVPTSSESMLLRAEMYRTKDRNDGDPCVDSSPQFRALPVTIICREQEFTYNPTAIDSDLDSLVYSWDRPYNPPTYFPVALIYRNGFSPTNPTPDKTFDTKNIPSTLNPLSGVIKMAVYSGTGYERYLTVVKADSYRDGVKIASVYREIPVTIFDCPTLPNGNDNHPPEVFIDGKKAEGIIVDATAGQEVRIPIQVKDYDFTGIGSQLQTVTMVPDGLLFSNDRATAIPCQVTYGAGQNLVLEPCAYLQNKTPFLDVNQIPHERKITGLSGLATEFVWQTDCRHIQTKTGVAGSNQGLYNFVMRVSDDHCPIPAINYPTITVRVKDPVSLTEPIMKGINVDLKGEVTYQWVPAIDSVFTFEKYLVESSTALNGLPPTQWNDLNTNLKDFQKERKNPNFGVYRYKNNNPILGFDILKKVPNRDWYMRMTAVSGCTDDVESPKSDQVRIIEPEAVASGVAPNPIRSKATITWNRAKATNAKTYPYFYYESKTQFYIWENDSVANGEVDVAANWYIRGDTNITSYPLYSNVCQDMVAFRIEARDTVITWRQGNGLGTRLDSLDTLTFSTFSMVDTLFMVTPGNIPRPKLDTLEVKANGDVYFKVDRAAAGTAGTFNIYSTVVDPANLLVSLDLAIEDSVLIPGQGANTNVREYIIEGVDICNTSITKNSFVYNTFIPIGNLEIINCNPVYRLTWDAPTGFNTQIQSYKILVDSSGTGTQYVQATSVNGTTTTADIPVFGEHRDYMFKVIAVDAEGAVNISAPHEYKTPSDLRTRELVPSPVLRCTYVEDNGTVSLSFYPSAPDTTENGVEYEFQYRQSGQAWQNFAGSGTVFYDKVKANGDQGDTAVTITSINANNGRYDFRARLLSGCTGTEPAAWSNEISSIYVTAMSRPEDTFKLGDITWNGTGVDYDLGPNNSYSIFKDTFNLRYADNLFGRDTLSSFIDGQNRDVCNGVFNYYVEVEDPQLGCLSRSSIDSALYFDRFPPPSPRLNFISYNLNTGAIDVYWTAIQGSDTDSLFFSTTDGFNSGLQAYRSVGDTNYRAQGAKYSIPFKVLDARDSAVLVGAVAKDGCGNQGAESDMLFHKSMNVDVHWNECDSSMIITWNPYEGFNKNYDVVYEVWMDSSVIIGSNATVLPKSQGQLETTFSHKIEAGDKLYRYYVKASSLNPAAASFESTSNMDEAFAIYADKPRYGYLTFVTVEDNVVKLEYNKDTLITVKGYDIYKGTNPLYLNKVGYVDYKTVKGDEFFEFTDANVHIDEYSYFYKVQILNGCNQAIDTSNFGRSILLNVIPNNEAVTNTLQWNEYVEWDSTVAYYNVYRGVDSRPTQNVYAVVPPSKGADNLFVDDVYDDLFSIGKFCYIVEAVQGQVTTGATDGYPNSLSPAKSTSNEVCITQQPLFYVPNAFAPDGVNKTFGPKGQFFDFSLFEMVIFNRWGEELYRTRDINKGWDGTVNGEVAQLGTYVYTIRFIDADGEEHYRKGTVTLVK